MIKCSQGPWHLVICNFVATCICTARNISWYESEKSTQTLQFCIHYTQVWAPQVAHGKESACQCRRCRFHPWVGKIPWRRKWQPTPVFLPGKFHGLRSLVGYSPWGRKETDMTEWLQFLFLSLGIPVCMWIK